MVKKKQVNDIEAIQAELDALKPTTPTQKQPEQALPMPTPKHRLKLDYGDPEITNIEKYPVQEDEWDSWYEYDAKEDKLRMILLVREMLHNFRGTA